jgi:oxygen-independent coproporphyrinogen-3 oxidase
MGIYSDALGLYISVPFCRSKCSFCNFASGVYPASHHVRYVERLCEELRGARRQTEAVGACLPETVDSVYLGGGTPSVLEPELLRQLFAAIRDVFRLTDDAEITMECAPGQIDDAVLAAMVECSVNRVSLGVQSFVDREAATTGRLHNRATALREVERLRAAGITRLSLDLIAGLPHQTMDSWNESLEVLVATGVEHASVYMLEVDDESRLGKEMLDGGARYHAGAVPKDDTIAAMFEVATERLAAGGLQQYEISNYAVAGQESKHNLKYWTRQPYLGVGLDAHSMLQVRSLPRGLKSPVFAQPVGTAAALPFDRCPSLRFSYTDDLDAFLDYASWSGIDVLTPRAEVEEAWFLGMRLNAGVSVSQLQAAFGEDAIAPFQPVLSRFEDDGLLSIQGDRIMLTPRGRLLSNEVFARILEVGDGEFCLS